MKKKLLAAAICAGLSVSVTAQEQGGGADANVNAAGTANAGIIAGTTAVFAAGAIIVSNGRSIKRKPPVITPPPVDPTCEGDDPLVDGVCIGTTTTVTVSGTTTVTVPVTFTYMPTSG